jgi:IS30 family transposase
MTQAQRDIKRKLKVINHAKETGNITKTCRYFGISRQSFYIWRKLYEEFGEQGFINSKPCPINPRLRTPHEIVEKIINLRTKYHFGPERIALYLDRFHTIKISASSVYHVLKRNGLGRLPRNTPRRTVASRRYEKQVPGHHVQVDVKFLQFKSAGGKKIKRYQYTAIDDATRIRALKIYERHNQAHAIKFINHVVECFPIRIETIRTDRGHEFQARFHWHVEDMGMQHIYIKPRSPHLNGKVERSHLTAQREFYQSLDYTDDVDLRKKLAHWEEFYNVHRPHGALGGKAPYEILKERLVG